MGLGETLYPVNSSPADIVVSKRWWGSTILGGGAKGSELNYGEDDVEDDDYVDGIWKGKNNLFWMLLSISANRATEKLQFAQNVHPANSHCHLQLFIYKNALHE